MLLEAAFDALAQGGAELKCPSCAAVFVAHPPKHSDSEIQSAVEKMTLSAGFVTREFALAIAESALPPRRTRSPTTGAPPPNESGTPSPFESTGFSVDGSIRCTSWLKN